jgi:hypothetical protein
VIIEKQAEEQAALILNGRPCMRDDGKKEGEST